MLPYHQVTKDFLKDVLQNNKRLLRMDQVKFINVPAFDEIGVKYLYDDVVKMPKMTPYFPAKFPKNTQCDKSYFYNVWNTLYPEQVRSVINYANSQRYTVNNEESVQNSITISDDWQRQLNSMPFTSKEKGRMTSLLKMKSKIGTKRKEKVKYDVHESLKRPRDTAGLA